MDDSLQLSPELPLLPPTPSSPKGKEGERGGGFSNPLPLGEGSAKRGTSEDGGEVALQLSIVLPCYNEAGNLPKIYAVLGEILAHQPGVEVLLVNNGSTDRSAAVFAELQASHTLPIRVVEIAQNQGYGHGILTGVRAARGEFIAWSHADLQTDPRDILAAYEKLLQSAHPERTVVKGRRKNRPLLDEFFTAGMAWLSSAALGQWLHDINAQPKLFPKSFVPLLDHAPTDFSLDLFFLYEAKTRGYTVLEQEVVFGKREHGEAKGGGTMKGKIKLIKRTLAYIFELRRRLRKPSPPPNPRPAGGQ